jgi:ubiquinone/menaquinone biosynthesis C-methylase UbiE
MSYIWRCRTKSVLLPFFRENFSSRHVGCGVGTGYFVAKALVPISFSQTQQELVLMDASSDALQVAKAHNLAVVPDAQLMCLEGDVKGPLPKELQDARFDSISMFNLFHCVPGSDKLRGPKKLCQPPQQPLSVDGMQHTR